MLVLMVFPTAYMPLLQLKALLRLKHKCCCVRQMIITCTRSREGHTSDWVLAGEGHEASWDQIAALNWKNQWRAVVPKAEQRNNHGGVFGGHFAGNLLLQDVSAKLVVWNEDNRVEHGTNRVNFEHNRVGFFNRVGLSQSSRFLS